MNREELYQLLDIDDPAEFQYFENLADFLECEEELDYDDVAELFHQNNLAFPNIKCKFALNISTNNN